MSEVVIVDTAGVSWPLSLVAEVADLAWTTGLRNGQPGGCQDASWLLGLRPDTTHHALAAGHRVEIYDGAALTWAGTLSEPERGSPWRCHAKGLAHRGRDFVALDGLTPTSVPDTAIDTAIGRGLPWTRLDSIRSTAVTGSNTTPAVNYVADLLDQLSGAWAVWADGVVTRSSESVTPDWLLLPAQAIGRTAEDYKSVVYGRYVSAVSGTPPDASSWATSTAAAPQPRLRREDALDLRDLGVLSSTTAQQLTDARLADVSRRLGWTTSIEVTSAGLTTLGGVPARLGQVRAGQMVRVLAMTDTEGPLTLGLSTDLVIGETRYTDGTDVIDLAPVGLAPRTHFDVLAASVRDAASTTFRDA